jgi:hypothetical protein
VNAKLTNSSSSFPFETSGGKLVRDRFRMPAQILEGLGLAEVVPAVLSSVNGGPELDTQSHAGGGVDDPMPRGPRGPNRGRSEKPGAGREPNDQHAVVQRMRREEEICRGGKEPTGQPCAPASFDVGDGIARGQRRRRRRGAP